uniref:Uncharacterized protein n=1 Tax=Trichuris muris TaxID=70415 RepID=A0A5S6QZS1_TRIMR
MEAYAEKPIGQNGVRLHETDCHMLWQKRKLRPAELLYGRPPFIRQMRLPFVLLNAKLSDCSLRHRLTVKRLLAKMKYAFRSLIATWLLETTENGSLVQHLRDVRLDKGENGGPQT